MVCLVGVWLRSGGGSPLLLAGAMALLTGCASAATGTSEGPNEGVPGQPCSSSTPIGSPSPTELFDEAAILRALSAPADPGPEPLVVLTFSVDSTGTLDGPRVIDGALAPDDADRVRAAAAHAFRDWIPPDRRFGARLRVEGGDEPRLSFHTRVECVPFYTRRARQRLQRWVAAREVREFVEIVVQFYVTEVGDVGEVRIRESSGDDGLDRSLVQLLENLRFHPALVDGEPVGTWSRLPVRLRP